jgi:hypothetical protein
LHSHQIAVGLEKANPAALIEAEKENLCKQIARINDNIASHAGFVERLMRQVKTLEQKEKELTARVAANKAAEFELKSSLQICVLIVWNSSATWLASDRFPALILTAICTRI